MRGSHFTRFFLVSEFQLAAHEILKCTLLRGVVDEILDHRELTTQPILLKEDLCAQVKDRISLLATEILNQMSSKDFVNVDFFRECFHSVRVWQIIKRGMFTERITTFDRANYEMLSIFLLRQILKPRTVHHQPAFTLVDKVYVILLFILFLNKVALCVDDFHEENFELLDDFSTNCAQSRDVTEQKFYFLLAR